MTNASWMCDLAVADDGLGSVGVFMLCQSFRTAVGDVSHTSRVSGASKGHCSMLVHDRHMLACQHAGRWLSTYCLSCRKGLQLLRHLFQQRPQDAADAFKGTQLAGLVNSDDPDTREAVMGLLTQLASSPSVAGDVKKVQQMPTLSMTPSIAASQRLG